MSNKTSSDKLEIPRVLYIQYTNPAAYPPLEHSSRILASDGWKMLFLGIKVKEADALCFPPNPNITVRKMQSCPPGWQQKLHYLRFSIWVIFWVLRWQPQWVYASDLLSCPVAMLLSFLPRIKVIYHEHDSPDLASNSFFIKLCLVARKWLANRAKICILPNQQRVENFTSEVGSNSQVVSVWNCPSLEEVSSPRLPLGGDEFWLLYHGSIVPSRLPSTVLSALAILPDAVKLRVIGYQTLGHQNYIQELKEIANRLGISDRIEFLPAIPTRSDLLKWCQKCDVGIAFMPNNSSDVNCQYMAGASNKAFDYLACGVPLLVSDLPDWKQMYVSSGYGLVCNPDDPDSIAAALNWYLEHPIQMREMGELGRQRILAEWNYECQFAKVYSKLCHF